MLGEVPSGSVFPSVAEHIGEAGPVQVRLGDASISSGGVMPTSSSTVGTMSMACAYWRRTPPPSVARRPAEARTMQGSATPPSCTSRFQRLKGVLPAMVQPHG